MSFLEKLFGRPTPIPLAATPLRPELIPPPASPPPPGAPLSFKLRDAQGRNVEIMREEWRTKVLPFNFQKAWDQPDQLAGFIEDALSAGFLADSLEPARQLHRIDTLPKRGAIFLGVALLQVKRFDEAATFIAESIRQHGEDAVLVTNLAKAQAGQGDSAVADRTLWHALELDPNYEFASSWYENLHRERAGEAAAVSAMEKLAAFPRSWRPQLWLAHAALQSGQLATAVAFYQSALTQAGQPAPADLLQKMSGDLGQSGHIAEIVSLTAPHFVAERHGMLVANNLIKAQLDLGQVDAARQLVSQLRASKRPDWNDDLGYWDTALAKAGKWPG